MDQGGRGRQLHRTAFEQGVNVPVERATAGLLHHRLQHRRQRECYQHYPESVVCSYYARP